MRPLVDGAGSSVLQALCASPAASISKFANLAFYAAPGAVIPTPATLLAIEVLLRAGLAAGGIGGRGHDVPARELTQEGLGKH